MRSLPERPVMGACLQVDEILGEYGSQVVEGRTKLCDVGVDVIDGLHAKEAVELLAVLGRPDLSGDIVPGAKSKAADLGLGDVNVVYASLQAVVP